MSLSVLEKNYEEAKRPYSQNELNYMRNNTYRIQRLGQVGAEHSKCGHFYLTKYNGRKEKEILEKNSKDTGNCSVCWKFNKTPSNLLQSANELVDYYQSKFEKEPEFLSYDLVECEMDFYKWLYNEFNDKRLYNESNEKNVNREYQT